MQNFSERHNSITGDILASLSSQIYFDSSVLFLYLHRAIKVYMIKYIKMYIVNSTELSKCIWELKDATISPFIEWSIVTKVLSKTQLNFFKLCLSEKLYITKSLNDPTLLNKKSELVNTCPHQSKLLLKNFKKNRYSDRSDTME